jgi:IstB-like ATP binding protein
MRTIVGPPLALQETCHPLPPIGVLRRNRHRNARNERASLIIISNKPFGRCGEVFADDVLAAAMIDRLVHYAEVITMKGDSYRLKDRDVGPVPATKHRTLVS